MQGFASRFNSRQGSGCSPALGVTPVAVGNTLDDRGFLPPRRPRARWQRARCPRRCRSRTGAAPVLGERPGHQHDQFTGVLAERSNALQNLMRTPRWWRISPGGAGRRVLRAGRSAVCTDDRASRQAAEGSSARFSSGRAASRFRRRTVNTASTWIWFEPAAPFLVLVEAADADNRCADRARHPPEKRAGVNLTARRPRCRTPEGRQLYSRRLSWRGWSTPPVRCLNPGGGVGGRSDRHRFRSLPGTRAFVHR